jgi:hypothetical protein
MLMKLSASSIARAGVTATVFALLGFTAGVSTGGREAADAPRSHALVTGPGDERYDAGTSSPQVLHFKDVDGNAVRLLYSPGEGWKYLDNRAAEDTTSVASNALSPVSPAFAESRAPRVDPMTVFIDGPTGYAYVWTPDAGWKFVGSISDGRAMP